MSTAAGWVIAALVALVLVVLIGAIVSTQHEHDACVESNTSAVLAGQPTVTC